MAVPNFYNDEFISRTLAAGFTDIQTWLDFIVDAITVQLPVGQRWSLVAADTYEAPADPDTGFTWRVKLVRSNATQMLVTFYDQNNVVIQAGGVTISGAGDKAGFISCGPKHLVSVVDIDFIIGTCVDPAPEAPNAPSVQVYCKVRRNASFTIIAFFNLPERCFANDQAAGTQIDRLQGPWFVQNTSGAYELATAGGSVLFYPCTASVIVNTQQNYDYRFTGNCYQFAWFDASLISGGRFAVPIDVGVVGYFMAIPGLTKIGSSFAAQGQVFLAVRVQ